MNSELLSILLPALCAGLLIISTHVPLGYQVLKRGIIFIDLAIAQIAALGMILAHTTGLHDAMPGTEYLLAAGLAMATAVLLSWLESRTTQLEALIGCFYVCAATGALLLLAYDPHGGELLKQTLNGSILWLTFTDTAHHAAIYVVLLVLFWQRPQLIEGRMFYLLFSLAITSSVQMVGIYLVFSTLIIPALATRHVTSSYKKVAYAYGIGALSYLCGLVGSATFDLPSGATIVWCLAVWGTLFRLLNIGTATKKAGYTEQKSNSLN